MARGEKMSWGSNLQTKRNKIIQDLIKLTEEPEQIQFLMELSTDISVDLVARNEQLKTQVQTLKNERDWLINKILERVNK